MNDVEFNRDEIMLSCFDIVSGKNANVSLLSGIWKIVGYRVADG